MAPTRSAATAQAAALAFALAAGVAAPAQAQDAAARYPTRTVQLVVPAPAGGPSDIVARMVAEKLGPLLGQTVVVENKAGAAQTLGTAAVARAEADGHTLLFTTSTPIVITPFTKKGTLGYDVKRDFTIVSYIGSTPLVMYAHPSLAAASLKDVIAQARAKPGTLAYGSYGNGSSAHLMGEFLSRQTATKLVHVPYKGVAPEVQDLVAGQIQLGFADIGVPAPFVKSGKLKALAVTGSKRAPQLPDVPTFAEQGITGMEPFSAWWGVFAPAATPKPVVDKLSEAVAKIVASPEFKARLASVGGEVTGATAARSAELLEADLRQWQQIIGSLPGVAYD